MTPVEKLEAAIAKLELQRAHASQGLEYWHLRIRLNHEVGADDQFGRTVIRYTRRADAILDETLHRTIDAQLNWLTDQAARMRVDVNQLGIPLYYRFAIALADAILGGDS